jgi:hypothetical protein
VVVVHLLVAHLPVDVQSVRSLTEHLQVGSERVVRSFSDNSN